MQNRGTYRPHHAQIPMQGFRWMQERAVHAHAIHCRLQLSRNLATFAHAADNQLPPISYTPRDLVNRANEIFLRQRVCLVELFQIRQGSAFSGEDMNGCGYRRLLRRG